MIRATINCAKSTSTLVFDEYPIISQDMIEITLMEIKVFRRPNLSIIQPDSRPPIGEKIAVIDANHEAWATVNFTSVLASPSRGKVVAGYPVLHSKRHGKSCAITAN